MLEHFWIAEQKAFTAMLLLSKTTVFHYYHFRTPSTHEMLMEQSIPKEQSATPQTYI